MAEFLQYFFSGIMSGSIYALVALGFVLVYKSSGIFNFAQGELLMVGGYICWWFLETVGLPFWAAMILTLIIAAALGIGLERFPFRPLIGQSVLALIMATVALSAMLKGFATLFWGRAGWQAFPKIFPEQALMIGEVNLSIQHLIAFSVAMLLFVIFVVFFRFTTTGLRMRAVAEDHQLSQSVGISVTAVLSTVWMIACITAAVGGVFLGSLAGMEVEHLSVIGLKALPAALLGGLDSIAGALIGGLLIGLIEALVTGYIGFGLKEVVAFIIMLLILVVRPYGLFGLERIERI